jgi:hypothetical protein
MTFGQTVGTEPRKRVDTLCHGPYRSGRSRHGAPVPSRQRMPPTTSRWSLAGHPVAAHWTSLSSSPRI